VRLAALEYVVFQSTWDATHSGPPTRFGQTFMLNPADNRFGLPAFYAFHACVWKHDPKGTFEPWNQQVRCGTQFNGALANEDAAKPPSVAEMGQLFTCAAPAGRGVMGAGRARTTWPPGVGPGDVRGHVRGC
jgi:hypothetical protein